jgi:hypothetical protein
LFHFFIAMMIIVALIGLGFGRALLYVTLAIVGVVALFVAMIVTHQPPYPNCLYGDYWGIFGYYCNKAPAAAAAQPAQTYDYSQYVNGSYQSQPAPAPTTASSPQREVCLSPADGWFAKYFEPCASMLAKQLPTKEECIKAQDFNFEPCKQWADDYDPFACGWEDKCWDRQSAVERVRKQLATKEGCAKRMAGNPNEAYVDPCKQFYPEQNCIAVLGDMSCVFWIERSANERPPGHWYYSVNNDRGSMDGPFSSYEAAMAFCKVHYSFCDGAGFCTAEDQRQQPCQFGSAGELANTGWRFDGRRRSTYSESPSPTSIPTADPHAQALQQLLSAEPTPLN